VITIIISNFSYLSKKKPGFLPGRLKFFWAKPNQARTGSSKF